MTELSPKPVPVPTPLTRAPRVTWPKFRRWAIRQTFALAVMLTLYGLSIGPMWWAWYSGMHVSTEANYWVIAFYEPLRQACRIEWINKLVEAYIQCWIL